MNVAVSRKSRNMISFLRHAESEAAAGGCSVSWDRFFSCRFIALEANARSLGVQFLRLEMFPPNAHHRARERNDRHDQQNRRPGSGLHQRYFSLLQRAGEPPSSL